MKPSNILPALLALTATHASLLSKRAGIAGTTTRYWDCCKASCSWPNKASVSHPVNTCDIADNPLSNQNAPSGCDGGGLAYTCSSQQPFAINDNLAYGFAAVTGSGSEADVCCGCYKLTFTSQIIGKVLIVQATNIGYDVSSTQFDLALPGGGVGAFPQGCKNQYNATTDNWGAQYGGVSSRAQCANLPPKLQAGCQFRFDWLQGANNPTITYERVACPAELLAKSGCKRTDDGSYSSVPSSGSTSSTTKVSSTTTTRVTTTTTTTQRTSTTQRSTTTTTSARSTTTTTAGGGSGTVAKYGQCGGINYTGSTKCVSGTTCQKQNDYYSQCL